MGFPDIMYPASGRRPSDRAIHQPIIGRSVQTQDNRRYQLSYYNSRKMIRGRYGRKSGIFGL